MWIVVLHLRYNNNKKRKNWRSVCKTKNLKVKWKLSWRQEAVSLWMMRVLKITNFQFFLSTLAFLSSSSMKLKGTKIRKNGKRKDVDFVDEYVLVLYSNRIFIFHFLSLDRTVCYSIRLVSLSYVKWPENELYNELS